MGILKGKTAVVSGSMSGIGLACARSFAGAGANIVLNGIDTAADAEKERSAIEKDFGVKAVYSPADMSKPKEIEEMITLAEKHSVAWMCSSIMPAFSTSLQSRSFRLTSGTRSWPSICPPPFMRSEQLFLK